MKLKLSRLLNKGISSAVRVNNKTHYIYIPFGDQHPVITDAYVLDDFLPLAFDKIAGLYTYNILL